MIIFMIFMIICVLCHETQKSWFYVIFGHFWPIWWFSSIWQEFLGIAQNRPFWWFSSILRFVRNLWYRVWGVKKVHFLQFTSGFRLLKWQKYENFENWALPLLLEIDNFLQRISGQKNRPFWAHNSAPYRGNLNLGHLWKMMIYVFFHQFAQFVSFLTNLTIFIIFL